MSKKVTVMQSNRQGWEKSTAIDADTLELAQALQVLKNHGYNMANMGQAIAPSQTTVVTGPPSRICGIRKGHKFMVTSQRKTEISRQLWQYAKSQGCRRFSDARTIYTGRTIWNFPDGGRIVINHLADGEGQVHRTH